MGENMRPGLMLALAGCRMQQPSVGDRCHDGPRHGFHLARIAQASEHLQALLGRLHGLLRVEVDGKYLPSWPLKNLDQRGPRGRAPRVRKRKATLL